VERDKTQFSAVAIETKKGGLRKIFDSFRQTFGRFHGNAGHFENSKSSA
jgi:hypothetical protein